MTWSFTSAHRTEQVKNGTGCLAQPRPRAFFSFVGDTMSGPPTARRNTASKRSDRQRTRYASVTSIAGMAGALLLAASAGFMARRRKTKDPVPPTPSPLGKARLLGIIRSSMEAIITIDENQRIVMFNPMAERLFDCPAAEAIGTSLARFVPERFRAGHESHVRQFGVTGVSDRQLGGPRILYGLRTQNDGVADVAPRSHSDCQDSQVYQVV